MLHRIMRNGVSLSKMCATAVKDCVNVNGHGNIMNVRRKTSLPKFQDSERKRIWGWLNPVFNRYDSTRIREVGPDRACAEWLLRNGAAVKFENSPEYMRDYNALPPINVRPAIIEVDASGSSISMAGGGFKYFETTKKIRKVKLHKCDYVMDDALYHLVVLAFSLRDLEVSSCANVTDDGILALSNMFDLENLYMYDLLGVKDRKKCLSVLENYLPKCKINFPWAQESEKKIPKDDKGK